MWSEKRRPDTPMGNKRQNKRVFEGEIRNRAYTLLLLVTVLIENDKDRIIKPVFYGVDTSDNAAKRRAENNIT